MIPNDYPIGIIGDGDVTTAKSVRHYSPGMIRTVLDLAEWCLGAGAKIEPLRALWIAPGSDIAELAESPAFWQIDAPGWRGFVTGPNDMPPDAACVRRDGTGKWEREVFLHGSLDTRWFGPSEGTHAEMLATITTYEQHLGAASYSPASTALDKLYSFHSSCERVAWVDSMSQSIIDTVPWPHNRRPGHVNPNPLDGAYVHVYDKRSAYMASAMMKQGRGDPQHWQPLSEKSASPSAWQAIENEMPGLWCITAAPPYESSPLPSPFSMSNSLPDHDWFYTPQVKLAKLMGYGVLLHEAWVWPKAHAVLTPWVQHLWHARQATRDTPAEAMIKQSFNMALGVMRRTPEEGQKLKWYHRPDWVGGLTACNYLRQMKRIMELPGYLGTSTDSIAITSNDPDPLTACNLMPKPGTPEKLGEYRHIATFSGAAATELIEMARAGESEARLFGRMNALGDEEDANVPSQA